MFMLSFEMQPSIPISRFVIIYSVIPYFFCANRDNFEMKTFVQYFIDI